MIKTSVLQSYVPIFASKPASTTWFLQSNGERICLEMAWQARLKFRSFTTHFYWVIPLLSPWHFAPMLSQLPSVLSSVFTGANPCELATLFSPRHRQRHAADPRDVNLQCPQQHRGKRERSDSCLCREGHQSREHRENPRKTHHRGVSTPPQHRVLRFSPCSQHGSSRSAPGQKTNLPALKDPRSTAQDQAPRFHSCCRCASEA